jgi:parallel beta-helix repeat protein
MSQLSTLPAAPRRAALIFAILTVLLSPVVAQAATIAAACPPGSLGTFTVQGFAPGDVVLVSGACTVNLVIPPGLSEVTLDGQGTATITAADATQPAILVRGRLITIRGFTISGGDPAVLVTGGGTAAISNNVIQGAANAGVVVQRSADAVITGSTIQNNPGIGVFVNEGGNARIGFSATSDASASGNTIASNGGGGVVVTRGSDARVAGNTIRNNTGDGVGVFRVSHADISSNVIEGNTGHGVNVGTNSGVNLGQDTGTGFLEAPNTTGAASPNQMNGISCFINSYADGRLGTLTGSAGAKSITGSCTDSLQP